MSWWEKVTWLDFWEKNEWRQWSACNARNIMRAMTKSFEIEERSTRDAGHIHVTLTGFLLINVHDDWPPTLTREIRNVYVYVAIDGKQEEEKRSPIFNASEQKSPSRCCCVHREWIKLHSPSQTRCCTEPATMISTSWGANSARDKHVVLAFLADDFVWLGLPRMTWTESMTSGEPLSRQYCRSHPSYLEKHTGKLGPRPQSRFDEGWKYKKDV